MLQAPNFGNRKKQT